MEDRCGSVRAKARGVGVVDLGVLPWGCWWMVLAFLMGGVGGGLAGSGESASRLAVAVFSCEVTPPLGHPLCGGWIRSLEAVDDPLLAKGVVVEGATRQVICAVDWCLLQTGAYDVFRRKIAAAAGVEESAVAVQTVHQHDAPLADANAQRLLDGVESAPRHLDLAFLEEVTDRVAAAVGEASRGLERVTHIGYGKAKVHQFASNRRVRTADGRIQARYSSTMDPGLRAAPEGLIDPWMRTVTFLDGERAIARLHYYASHPMSFYGQGRASSDTVGLARQRLEREEGVPQIYFTGCAGNITAGKYNDGSERARGELTDRIYTGMREAVAATEVEPVRSVEWRTVRVEFVLREEPEWAEETGRRRLANTGASVHERLKAALDLAWIERCRERSWVDISELRLGTVSLVHLPGEAFVEYQLHAQALRPGGFVAVAAYGDSGPGYICLDAALAEGGYEPTMSRVGPPSEVRLKEAMAELLGRGSRGR